MQTHHDLPVSGVSAGEIASEGYDLDALLNQHFAGRVVRKDLTKQLKEGANVPVYVLEYLLGMYCASDDDDVVEQGLQNVKRILADNYVRPDEAEKVKSLIRERGSYKIIDKVSVKLNQKKDVYEAQLSNLGIKDALVRQAAGPVRWVECVQAMQARGVNTIVECGPGKALAGMVKRISPELAALNLLDPATLAEVKAALAV